MFKHKREEAYFWYFTQCIHFCRGCTVFPLETIKVFLFFLPLLHQMVFLSHWNLHPRPDIDWTPHSLCPIKAQLTDPSISPLDQPKSSVSSQQEDVSIPLLSWQEVGLLKGLLGNVFLRPIFSFSPSLTNGDELVINMAATLSNRAFFVDLESHVSKRSSRACHSSRPLSLKLPTLDHSAVEPAQQEHVSHMSHS